MRKIGWLVSLVQLTIIATSSAHAQTEWQMAPPLPKATGEIVGAVVGNDWYVMAGLDTATHEPSGLVYVFKGADQRWLEKKMMPVPAHHVMVAAANGKVYVFGGFVSDNSAAEKSAETGWPPMA